MTGNAGADIPNKLTPEVYRRLCRARAFMDDCYARPLDVDQISREACFSRYHFIRTSEKTPHIYVRDQSAAI